MPILLACLLSLSLPPLPSQPAAAVVDFDRDVRPLLSDRCFACHGPDAAARRGDLRLDTPDGLATVIDLVRPEDSLILERVTTQDPDDRMPPP